MINWNWNELIKIFRSWKSHHSESPRWVSTVSLHIESNWMSCRWVSIDLLSQCNPLSGENLFECRGIDNTQQHVLPQQTAESLWVSPTVPCQTLFQHVQCELSQFTLMPTLFEIFSAGECSHSHLFHATGEVFMFMFVSLTGHSHLMRLHVTKKTV